MAWYGGMVYQSLCPQSSLRTNETREQGSLAEDEQTKLNAPFFRSSSPFSPRQPWYINDTRENHQIRSTQPSIDQHTGYQKQSILLADCCARNQPVREQNVYVPASWVLCRW
jgi:hypothetical protein